MTGLDSRGAASSNSAAVFAIIRVIAVVPLADFSVVWSWIPSFM